MILKEVLRCIKEYKSFLISAHTSMEGDALGSELGFYYLLKKLGKQALILNEETAPYGYEFLPGLDKIRIYSQNIEVPAFDCFVALDCSNLKRTGQVYTVNKQNKPVINIDHHISNSFFGAVNWVDPSASCTCEMVYHLYKKLGVALDKNAALSLYAGILTDTGSFRYSNTTSTTHKVAAELISCGIDVAEVHKSIYANIPYSDLRFLSKILPTMRVEMKGKIVWFQVYKEQLRRQKKIFFDLTENILSFARSLAGIEVAVLFHENLTRDNEVRINFRSQGKVDVNKIAGLFGGGGHKSASGATVKGRIEDIRRKVLARIREAINNA